MKIVYAHGHNFLLEKTERTLCLWLEDEAQIGLSVRDALERRRAASMPIKRGWDLKHVLIL